MEANRAEDGEAMTHLESLLLSAVLRYQAHRDKTKAFCASLEPCEEEVKPWDEGASVEPCWKRYVGGPIEPCTGYQEPLPAPRCPACKRNESIVPRLRCLRAQTGGYASQVAQLARRVLRERGAP